MTIVDGMAQFLSPSPGSIDNLIFQGIDSKYPNYQELLSTFQSLFGVDARQDSSRIYINKANLPLLTSQADNTAESLLISLLLQNQKYESTSERSLMVITRLFSQFIKNKNANLVKDILLIDLYAKPRYQYGISIIEPIHPLSPSDF